MIPFLLNFLGLLFSICECVVSVSGLDYGSERNLINKMGLQLDSRADIKDQRDAMRAEH